MSAVESEPRHSEAEVANWRMRELLRAGYGWDQAVLLACQNDVDLHRAVELLLRGCPPETAVRILL